MLPFADRSGDPGREYFADGISEDLVTGLARIRWLFVIARNSTFVYKHRAVDAKQVSRELGVRYILEGSVRRAGNRLRITAQLVDATTGGHLWAERYERELGDIFAVQDDITRSVAAAIEPRLLAAEGIRALARRRRDLGAWELVAQAQTHFWRMSRADHRAAIEPLRQAIEAHPDYAPAHGRLGFCLVFAAHMGWSGRRPWPAGRPRARHTGDRARRLRSLGTYRTGLLGDDGAPHGGVDRGVQAGGEPQSQFRCGPFPSQPGIRLRRPRRRGDRARKRSDPAQSARSRDGVVPGRHRRRPLHGRPLRQAAHFTTEALRLRPGFQGAQRLRCASLARSGRVEEARAFLADVRREQPRLSLEWVRGNVPYQTRELMDQFVEGLRRAGLR